MPQKSRRKLILPIHPRDLKLCLKALDELNLKPVQRIKARSGLWLKTDVPFDRSREFMNKLFSVRRPEDGKRIFQTIKCQTILSDAENRRFKKDLKPFPLVADDTPAEEILWVDPRGLNSKKKRADTLYLEYGRAFGVGNHPTTRMSARLFYQLLQSQKKPAVLDLGCGTGVLPMAARKWGVPKVWAVDNDPTALEEAAWNFRQNGIRNIVLKESMDQIRRTFDIIIANINLKIPIQLKVPILQHLKTGGFLIVSGVITKDCERLLKAFHDLSLIQRFDWKDWSAVLLRK
jgi:ribosomal protein L11 methylase PrmA